MLTTLLCLLAGGMMTHASLPAEGTVLAGFREDSVRARLSQMPLHDVEGLWEVAGEGSLMAVERTATSGVYVMALVCGSDPSLRPGTVMGYLTSGATRGSFEARIFTGRSESGVILTHPGHYSATLTGGGETLAIKPVGRAFRVNWWRLLLPYMYRSLITPLERESRDTEGFRRVYPPAAMPLNPRYL